MLNLNGCLSSLHRRVQGSLSAPGGAGGRHGQGEEDSGTGDHQLQTPTDPRDRAGESFRKPSTLVLAAELCKLAGTRSAADHMTPDLIIRGSYEFGYWS